VYQDDSGNDKQKGFPEFSAECHHKSSKQNHDAYGVAAFDYPDKEIIIDRHFYGSFCSPGCELDIVIEYFEKEFWMIGHHFSHAVNFEKFRIELVQVPLIKYNQDDIGKQELAQKQ